MKKHNFFQLMIAVILLFGAFGGTAAAEQNAMVRVVHTSPDAPAVDIYVDGNIFAETVEFKNASDYTPIAEGEHEFKFVQAHANGEDETILEQTIHVEAGKRYSVIAAGLMNELEGLLAEDVQIVTEGKSKVRLIHVSPDTANIDMSIEGEQLLGADASFKTIGEYIEVNPSLLNIESSIMGITDLNMSTEDFVMEPGTVYSIYLVGLANGSSGLGTIILFDNETIEPAVLPPAGPSEGEDSQIPSEEHNMIEESSSDEEIIIPTAMPQTGLGGTSSSTDASFWIWVFAPIIIAGLALTFIYNRYEALTNMDYEE